jgi:hypothetical protein
VAEGGFRVDLRSSGSSKETCAQEAKLPTSDRNTDSFDNAAKMTWRQTLAPLEPEDALAQGNPNLLSWPRIYVKCIMKQLWECLYDESEPDSRRAESC